MDTDVFKYWNGTGQTTTIELFPSNSPPAKTNSSSATKPRHLLEPRLKIRILTLRYLFRSLVNSGNVPRFTPRVLVQLGWGKWCCIGTAWLSGGNQEIVSYSTVYPLPRKSWRKLEENLWNPWKMGKFVWLWFAPRISIPISHFFTVPSNTLIVFFLVNCLLAVLFMFIL